MASGGLVELFWVEVVHLRGIEADHSGGDERPTKDTKHHAHGSVFGHLVAIVELIKERYASASEQRRARKKRADVFGRLPRQKHAVRPPASKRPSRVRNNLAGK